MCIDMCIDTCIDMCMHMSVHLCRYTPLYTWSAHVCIHIYMHMAGPLPDGLSCRHLQHHRHSQNCRYVHMHVSRNVHVHVYKCTCMCSDQAFRHLQRHEYSPRVRMCVYTYLQTCAMELCGQSSPRRAWACLHVCIHLFGGC